MNIKANAKKNFSKQRGAEMLQGLAGAILYAFVPTLLKLEGLAGVAAGAASSLALGIVFDWPGAVVAAPILAGMHLLYTEGQGIVKSVTGNYIWRYDASAPVPERTLGDGARSSMMSYLPATMADVQIGPPPNGGPRIPGVPGLRDYDGNISVARGPVVGSGVS